MISGMAAQTDPVPVKPAIVWFRRDLRIHDNQALIEACESGKPAIFLYILDETADEPRPMGAAQRWWLHHSLASLSADLRKIGGTLLLRSGKTANAIENILQETGSDWVLWNRRYDPAGIAADTDLKNSLNGRGVRAVSYAGQLLHEPTQVRTLAGGPFKVYTPFWKAFSGFPEPRPPFEAPKALNGYRGPLASDNLDDWKLLPTEPDWAGGMREEWTPGEAGAHRRLTDFLETSIENYADGRNVPGVQSTSKLSPHLALGEVTPFQIWDATRRLAQGIPPRDVEVFRKEVVWREFAHHLLFQFPKLATENFNGSFDAFPWRSRPDLLGAWKRGQTGYPIVDAGMRQLWQTGWMHIRVRMIAASFLIKDLMTDWRVGEQWFWDTLVDACPANNPASWQWVAGSGADAAPYYRVFNPVLQGEKFDANGDYVRQFVPEIANLPNAFVHRPWAAPAHELERAGVVLGATYPNPVVDHGQARDHALAAYKALRTE